MGCWWWRYLAHNHSVHKTQFPLPPSNEAFLAGYEPTIHQLGQSKCQNSHRPFRNWFLYIPFVTLLSRLQTEEFILASNVFKETIRCWSWKFNLCRLAVNAVNAVILQSELIYAHQILVDVIIETAVSPNLHLHPTQFTADKGQILMSKKHFLFIFNIHVLKKEIDKWVWFEENMTRFYLLDSGLGLVNYIF